MNKSINIKEEILREFRKGWSDDEELEIFIAESLDRMEREVREETRKSLGWKYIWCDETESIEPLITDLVPKQDTKYIKNDHDALDLVCGDCKFLIATLHEEKPKA